MRVRSREKICLTYSMHCKNASTCVKVQGQPGNSQMKPVGVKSMCLSIQPIVELERFIFSDNVNER